MNKVGRPRTTSFSPEEMDKLGQEMLEWIKSNDPIHLSQWYTIHKGFTYNEWKTFIRKEEFVPYYEQALKLVGLKYLDGTIHNSIAQRWQRIYFKDLKEEENEQLEFANSLRNQTNQNIDERIMQNYRDTINLLSKLQSAARNIDDNNISNEQKS